MPDVGITPDGAGAFGQRDAVSGEVNVVPERLPPTFRPARALRHAVNTPDAIRFVEDPANG